MCKFLAARRYASECNARSDCLSFIIVDINVIPASTKTCFMKNYVCAEAELLEQDGVTVYNKGQEGKYKFNSNSFS